MNSYIKWEVGKQEKIDLKGMFLKKIKNKKIFN